MSVISSPNDFVQTIDLEVLRSFDDPDSPAEESLMIELIDLYLAETSRLLQAIREAIDESNWDQVKLKSHSLRGSSANLGLNGIAAISDLLEHFEEGGPGRFELMAGLEQEFVRINQLLTEERERRLKCEY
ncbi:MAG TPA: Hpt domain-containing protein [Pyrinomonadaceae bacterium]